MGNWQVFRGKGRRQERSRMEQLRELKKDSVTVKIWDDGSGQEKPVLWLPVSAEEEKTLADTVRQANGRCALITVTGFDWNRDLSPWPAPKVFARGEDFQGRAKEFLDFLIRELLPEAEGSLGFPVRDRGLLGYSMAGLFAVYAMYQTSLFQRVGSVSGSLWFDGWVRYAKTHSVQGHPCIYLSLGKQERSARNPRMAAVKDCTEELTDWWNERFPVIYEINPGGHFAEPEKRMRRAVESLLGMKP